MDSDSYSKKTKSHRVSNVALICGALLIVCLTFAVLGMALGLLSQIIQCGCDNNDERVDTLEVQVSNLVSGSPVSELQELVEGLKRDLDSLAEMVNGATNGSTKLNDLTIQVDDLQNSLTTAIQTSADSLANLETSLDEAFDELLVNVSGMFSDHIGECNTTEVAVCTVIADPGFVPGFTVCSTPTVSTQMAVSGEIHRPLYVAKH